MLRKRKTLNSLVKPSTRPLQSRRLTNNTMINSQGNVIMNQKTSLRRDATNVNALTNNILKMRLGKSGKFGTNNQGNVMMDPRIDRNLTRAFKKIRDFYAGKKINIRKVSRSQMNNDLKGYIPDDVTSYIHNVIHKSSSPPTLSKNALKGHGDKTTQTYYNASRFVSNVDTFIDPINFIPMHFKLDAFWSTQPHTMLSQCHGAYSMPPSKNNLQGVLKRCPKNVAAVIVGEIGLPGYYRSNQTRHLFSMLKDPGEITKLATHPERFLKLDIKNMNSIFKGRSYILPGERFLDIDLWYQEGNDLAQGFYKVPLSNTVDYEHHSKCKDVSYLDAFFPNLTTPLNYCTSASKVLEKYSQLLGDKTGFMFFYCCRGSLNKKVKCQLLKDLNNTVKRLQTSNLL